MKIYHSLLFLLTTATFFGGAQGHDDDQTYQETTNKEAKVHMSSTCAAVLLATGTAVGVAGASMIPASLCSLGFCSMGIQGGSFASWWQSMFPLVAKGSLFAQLQSLAMVGTGTQTIVISAVLGGTTAASYIQEFCTFVDEADPDTATGQAIGLTAATVGTATYAASIASETASEAAGMIKDQCAASETCSAMSSTVVEQSETAGKWLSSVWNDVSTYVSNSATAIMLRGELILLEEKKRDHLKSFGRIAFDIVRNAEKTPEGFNHDILSMYKECLENVHRMENEMKSSLSSAYKMKQALESINVEKERFGTNVWPYIISQSLSTNGHDFPDNQLFEVATTTMKHIQPLEKDIEEKKKQISEL